MANQGVTSRRINSIDHPDPQPDSWLQAHCALFTHPSGSRPVIPWHELGDAVDAWRRQSAFDRFFFMRKLPGLRLRWQGPNVLDGLQSEVVDWLTGLQEAGAIPSFSLPEYEPEVDRFGGPVGMAIAHDHFDGDAAVALAYERLDEPARGDVPRHVISVAICTDLFRKVLDQWPDIRHVWSALARETVDLLAWFDRPFPERDGPAGESIRKLISAAVQLEDSFWAALTPEVADLVREATRANARTAAQMRSASEAGRLLVDPRSWLSSVATFHMNRMGLGLEPDELALSTAAARDAVAVA